MTLAPPSHVLPLAIIVTLGIVMCTFGAPAGDRLLPGDEELVTERALAGGTILLGPGKFVFDSGWHLNAEVEVRGKGRDETVLVFRQPSDMGRAAIAWDGPGQMVLADLTIRWTAEGSMAVGVLARGGHVSLSNIVIHGASTPSETFDSIGISFQSSSTGLLRNSRFEGHGNTAVALDDTVTVLIERTEIEDNAGAGLTLDGHSLASIQESTIGRNHDGIVAGGEARFEILNSKVVSNVDAGVRGTGNSAGLIVDSVIAGQGGTGLTGSDNFWLTLVGSNLRHNSTGLATYGGNPAAKYLMVDSTIEDNAFHAVTSSILASIALAGNIFERNGLDSAGAALVFSIGSRGSAIGNTISRNGGTGIMCLERSVAPLLGNTIEFNGEYGLERVENSRCRESDTTFEGNALGNAHVWPSQ